MNINNVRLEAVATSPKQYPSNPLPEIVLLGRSNVGKSSLINASFNRKNMARTSSTPGKTATINFYNVDEVVRIVDLPGYGYAKRTDNEKEKWAKMIEDYIHNGHYIRRFIQLIDIRHLPTENDKIMHEWVQSRGIPQTIVFTKADKIGKTIAIENIEKAKKELGENIHSIAFSAITKQGVDEFLELLEKLEK